MLRSLIHAALLTEVVFCWHAILLLLIIFGLPFLRSYLSYFGDQYLLLHFRCVWWWIHYYIHCRCYSENTPVFFIAILYRLLVSLVLVGSS